MRIQRFSQLTGYSAQVGTTGCPPRGTWRARLWYSNPQSIGLNSDPQEVQQCPDCSHACLTRPRILVRQFSARVHFSFCSLTKHTLSIQHLRSSHWWFAELASVNGNPRKLCSVFRRVPERCAHGDGRTWRRTASRLLMRSRRGFRLCWTTWACTPRDLVTPTKSGHNARRWCGHT